MNYKSHQEIYQGQETLPTSMSLPSNNSKNVRRLMNNSCRQMDTAPTPLIVMNTNYARASSSGFSHPPTATAAPKAFNDNGK
jgi:hypothetical protein